MRPLIIVHGWSDEDQSFLPLTGALEQHTARPDLNDPNGLPVGCAGVSGKREESLCVRHTLCRQLSWEMAMSFKAFIDAAKTIITVGASANASARQEIRDVVGKLGDELDRALSLTDSYLVGARFSYDDNELARYLADVDGKLMGSYHEHHICAGLYHLADKFEQVFDPTRFSVTLTNYNEIPRLIDELKNGEQVVLDDLTDIAGELRNYSSELLSGTMEREEILDAVECHREQVDRYRKKIRKTRRELLAKL